MVSDVQVAAKASLSSALDGLALSAKDHRCLAGIDPYQDDDLRHWIAPGSARNLRLLGNDKTTLAFPCYPVGLVVRRLMEE